MVLEREAKLVDDAGTETPLAHEHDRVQLVAEPPEVLFLPVVEPHARIIGVGRGGNAWLVAASRVVGGSQSTFRIRTCAAPRTPDCARARRSSSRKSTPRKS